MEVPHSREPTQEANTDIPEVSNKASEDDQPKEDQGQVYHTRSGRAVIKPNLLNL
jgi:hypothetical protein